MWQVRDRRTGEDASIVKPDPKNQQNEDDWKDSRGFESACGGLAGRAGCRPARIYLCIHDFVSP